MKQKSPLTKVSRKMSPVWPAPGDIGKETPGLCGAHTASLRTLKRLFRFSRTGWEPRELDPDLQAAGGLKIALGCTLVGL